MSYFKNKKQAEYKADFGFSAPHKTTTPCSNPVFLDPYYHRIAIMKVEHFGSKGDREESGAPGWVAKSVCTGCGKEYFKKKRFFVLDK